MPLHPNILPATEPPTCSLGWASNVKCLACTLSSSGYLYVSDSLILNEKVHCDYHLPGLLWFTSLLKTQSEFQQRKSHTDENRKSWFTTIVCESWNQHQNSLRGYHLYRCGVSLASIGCVASHDADCHPIRTQSSISLWALNDSHS